METVWGKCAKCQKAIGRESGIYSRVEEESNYCESCFKEGLSRVEVKALADVKRKDREIDLIATASTGFIILR